MSIRRLLLTAAVMAGVAAALAALTPALPVMAGVLAHPQRTADRDGADALVLAAAGLLAWLFWGWGAAGLALTAGSALPGLLGSAARASLGVVLPAGARRSAALLLGIGLGVTGPLLATALPSAPAVAAAATTTVGGRPQSGVAFLVEPAADAVPDWPASTVPDWPVAPAPGDAVPDWPVAPAPGSTAPDHPPGSSEGAHVVVRGDCLWSIAETWLLREHGRPPSTGEVARAVQAWWAANDDVIGPDPDLLLPGQILRPPPPL